MNTYIVCSMVIVYSTKSFIDLETIVTAKSFHKAEKKAMNRVREYINSHADQVPYGAAYLIHTMAITLDCDA